MKTLAFFAGCGLAFLTACLLEPALREARRTAIPVTVQSGLQVRVSASVRPDFLWVGEAWSIDIKSETPVSLTIDNRKWQAVIPPGPHTLYSNHDANNISTYGPACSTTPQSITVTAVEE
jgi:hypothetical protein